MSFSIPLPSNSPSFLSLILYASSLQFHILLLFDSLSHLSSCTSSIVHYLFISIFFILPSVLHSLYLKFFISSIKFFILLPFKFFIRLSHFLSPLLQFSILSLSNSFSNVLHLSPYSSTDSIIFFICASDMTSQMQHTWRQ